jgi:signal transduction histidine kinase
MQDELYHNTEAIIEAAQALLQGDLSARQAEFIRIILANAEKFIHLAAEFLSVPLEEVSADLRHELGNPLTPIFGYSELLLTRLLDGMDDAQVAQVYVISRCTSELRRIVDQLVIKARVRAS